MIKIHCFVSRILTKYPSCRFCHDEDGREITVPERKSKECFSAFSDDCGSHGQNCNMSYCDSYPCMCITEPCPLVEETYNCRCSLGLLDESGIEFFERKSGITHNPGYVLHKGIAFASEDEEFEHNELLENFRRKIKGNVNVRVANEWGYYHDYVNGEVLPVYLGRGYSEHVKIMAEFNCIAQTIHKMRENKPVNGKTDNDDRKMNPGVNGEWVSSKDFLRNNNDANSNKTLQSWRNKGVKNSDKTSGCDVKGNSWKKLSSNKVEYWVWFE